MKTQQNNLASRIRAAALAVAAGLVVTANASAVVVYHVDAGIAVSGGGSSWADAFKHLQDALAIAQPGNEIWVKQGTYYPDRSNANPAGTGDRATSFMMESGVKILGGFVGNESAASQRTPALYVTVLSGDIGVPGTTGDNSYNIVEAPGVNNLAVLDGFTLSKGIADGVTTPDTYVGGGVYIYAGSQVVINQCVFQECWGRGGPAIASYSSSPTITNCRFLNNYGAVRPGAVEFTGSPNSIVRDCWFESNSGAYGGALYLNESSSGCTIERCGFYDNFAVNGGAVSLAGFSASTFRACLFLKNQTGWRGAYQTQWNGGAVRNWCTDSVFVNCVFNANHAEGNGGALFDGGPSGSNATIVNCTMVNNYSRDGGAVSGVSGHTPAVRNSIFWDNTAGGANPNSIVGGVIVASSNLTAGIVIDPMFMDEDGPDNMPGSSDDDLRLAAGSPMIDTGDLSHLPAGTATDFAGNARVQAGTSGGTPMLDIGALEFAPSAPPACFGDSDGDFDVDFSDIVATLANWGSGGPLGDANFDEKVNFNDVLAVLANFGVSCQKP